MQTCLYRNGRDRMVILRCIGPESYFLEKVIFPFETWAFDAPREAEVELWCHGIGGAELLERLSSNQLRLQEPEEIGLNGLAASNVTIDCPMPAAAGGLALKI